MRAPLDRSALARTLSWTTIGGAAGGFWAFLAIHGLGLGDAYWVTLGLVSLGVAAGSTLSRPRPWLVLFAPALSAAATFALSAFVPGEEAAGLAVWGLLTTLPLALGLSLRRVLSASLLGAASGVVAVGLARTVEVGALAPLGTPALLGYPIAGGVMGFVLGLAGLPRSLGARDGTPALRVPSGLGGEFKETVERAVKARDRVQRALRSRPGSSEGRAAVEKAVDELVGRVVTLADRWRGVEDDLAGIEDSLLAERLAKLGERVEGTTDPEAREEFERAIRSIEDQRRMHGDIRRARERTLARLHGHLAALDRVHLAVVRLRSADAHRFASEIQPVLEELSAVGTDAELTATAIDEAGRVS